jgi:hypothetical protein
MKSIYVVNFANARTIFGVHMIVDFAVNFAIGYAA